MRADEANAGAIGMMMNLPRRGEEHVDVFLGEEIGCAVGP